MEAKEQFPERFLALMAQIKTECFSSGEEGEVAETVVAALKQYVRARFVLDALALRRDLTDRCTS